LELIFFRKHNVYTIIVDAFSVLGHVSETAYRLLMLRPTCSEVWSRSCCCCWSFHRTFIQQLRHLMITTLSFSVQISLLIRPC